MQNKGAIRLFAILMALVCLFQISFTFVTRSVERKAKNYAHSEDVKTMAKEMADEDGLREKFIFDSIAKAREKYYFDSIASEYVYNIGLKKYTYKECKEKEINLGLDLKGGMNVTLEVSVMDILRALSNYSANPTFNKAMEIAKERQKDSQEDFITLFEQAFVEVDPNARLASPDIFSTRELKEKGITTKSTNAEVLEVIRKEAEGAIDRTFNILGNRIDKFGVAQPNIQKLENSGRILVELPGVKDPDRARKVLQTTAELQFWLTYNNEEVVNVVGNIYNKVYELEGRKADAEKAETEEEEVNETKVSVTDTLAVELDTTKSELMQKLESDTASLVKEDAQANVFPLYPIQRAEGPVVGRAEVKDTAKINAYLRMQEIKSLIPRDLKFAWTAKPIEVETQDGDKVELMELIALKGMGGRGGKGAVLEGDKVVNAYQDYNQNGGVEIVMAMNKEGARMWKRITGENIGKSVAVVLDGYVYSFPNVNDEIPNGRSTISGNFTVQEAKDLANVLKAGKLPAPAKIVEEAIVGPSLGQESINSGFISFIVALILVLIYMLLYYNTAGFAADMALFTNFFYIIGVLASIGAVLTLPGIAGIVLTMGMAVDANVIIYERIREELSAGKGLRLAVTDGFKNSYSAIIDGNVTTLLTGIVLFSFGSGPVQGFATTLIIGIFTTLFTAIFITRLFFERRLNANKPVHFSNSITKNAFKNVNINFLKKRKIFYFVSTAVIVLGLVSLFTRGLDFGVDFTGGRTYVVRFDQNVATQDIAKDLTDDFESAPVVKTFGTGSQVKITTKYLVEAEGVDVDDQVETKLYEGLSPYLNGISKADFKATHIMSSQKVGPTIADDIIKGAFLSVIFALIIIFIYLVIRFAKWQYALGAVVALFHDTLILLSVFSIFHGILPFSLEIDQAFIAAILTVIGYSINDTVIIFDRIREFTGLNKKLPLIENTNSALNSTLARTFNTSMTTLFTLLIIFVFGGEVIRGFIFALMIGVAVGTYSSWFIATPIFYDTVMKQQRKEVGKKKN